MRHAGCRMMVGLSILLFAGRPAFAQVATNVLINEVLYDPSSTALEGDANGDGVVGVNADEFVEIVNKHTGAIDITGWKLRFNSSDFFTFPSTLLGPQAAVVVFGGGTPTGAFGSSTVHAASSGWSGLLNAGGVVSLVNGLVTNAVLDYTPFPNDTDQSFTRNPDVSGGVFVAHGAVGPCAQRYSPGTRSSGQPFAGSGLTNTPPCVQPIGDKVTQIGRVVSVPLSAFDVENHAVTFSVSNAPATAVLRDFGNTTGLLVYTGQVADAGSTFQISIYAGDGQLSSRRAFSLHVAEERYTGLVLNEYLSDPDASGGIHVDANNDGVNDAAEDEFVEVVNNTTGELDFAGFRIRDASALRHVFTSRRVVRGGSMVVFGGGHVRSFTNPPAQISSSGGLDLQQISSDSIFLLSPTGALIDQVDYPSAGQAISDTRLPDILGAFTDHLVASTNAARASPGLMMHGKAFLTNQPPILVDIGQQFVAVSNLLVVDVRAYDPADRHAVTLSASGLPANAVFFGTNNAGTLSFTPDATQAGVSYLVTLVASDVNGAETSTVPITVIQFSAAEDVWINEIHYDNVSGDLNEGVEVAGVAGTDLGSYALIEYDGTAFNINSSNALSGTLDAEQCGFGAAWFPISGIENDTEGMALVKDGSTVIQFLSWEGAFTAGVGAAAGVVSVNIGVSEGGTTPVDSSLQLAGTGTAYAAFAWQTNRPHSRGAFNAGQSTGPCDVNLVLKKSVYAGHDGGASCPGGELLQGVNGAPITYCFAVSNAGSVALSDVTVTDAGLAGFSPANLGVLDPGDEVTTFFQTDILGDLTNVASAVGTPPAGPAVTNEDSAVVDQIAPAIGLQKSVHAGPGGAGCPGAELIAGTNGTPVTYCFVVTNPGDVALTNVVLTDGDLAGFAPIPLGTLLPGQTSTSHFESVITGSLTNTASVSGEAVAGIPASDDDTAAVAEIHPDLTLQKTVYAGHDGGASVPGFDAMQGTNGALITYGFVVSNAGDAALSDVTVADADLPGFFPTNLGVLNPGATATAFFETIIGGDFVNTATATGSVAVAPALLVSAFDTATVDAIAPGLVLQKTVYLGYDGGASCPGTDFVQGTNGTEVTYCFAVSNAGDVALGNVEVSDGGLNPSVLLSLGSLAVGGTASEFAARRISGNLTNTAAASGAPPAGPDVMDSDTAEVRQIHPALTLEKTVYAGHDGGASCPGVELAQGAHGAPITFCFEVMNTGDIALHNVSVGDLNLTPPLATNLGTLAAGQGVTVFTERTLTGDVVNVATALGAPSVGPDASDTDTAAVDLVAPALVCPADLLWWIPKSATGATVNYSVPDAGGVCSMNVNCSPPPGSVFPLGTTLVTCVAQDLCGNASTCAFNVIVFTTEGDSVDPCRLPAVLDGALDSTYALLAESPFGVPATSTNALHSDFVGEGSARTLYTINGGETQLNIETEEGHDADIEDILLTWDATNLFLAVVGPNAFHIGAGAGEVDRADLFVALDTTNSPAGSETPVQAPGGNAAGDMFDKLVDFAGWSPGYFIGLERVDHVGGGTYAQINTADGTILGTDTDAGTDNGAVFQFASSRASGVTEFRIAWSLLGGAPDFATGACWNIAAYTTADADGYDAYDTAPGYGQGLNNGSPFEFEQLGDTPFDADHCAITNGGDALPDPVSGNFDSSCGFAESDGHAGSGVPIDLKIPASDNSGRFNNDEADTIQEYLQVRNVGQLTSGCGPRITLEKTVYLGHDLGASCPGQESAQSTNGAAITYCFEVINTGGTLLTNVFVTDSGVSPPVLLNLGELNPGQSTGGYVERWINGSLVNTAAVFGTPPGGGPVTASDSAVVVEEGLAAMALQKTVYLGHDDGATCPGAESVETFVGGPLTYCFEVSNIGEVLLTNVVVFDSAVDPAVFLEIGDLPAGQSVSVYAERVAGGDLVNVATASGQGPGEAGAFAQDEATVFVVPSPCPVLDLGTLGGDESRAFDVNNSLQVVGWSETAAGHIRAFLWENGTMMDLGVLPGGTNSEARGINEAGDICGFSDGVVDIWGVLTRIQRAFVLTNGTLRELPPLGMNEQKDSYARKINNEGKSIGQLTRPSAIDPHAVFWTNDVTKETDLSTFSGNISSEAWALNDSNFVVGFTYGWQIFDDTRPFVWWDVNQNGMNDFIDPPGGHSYSAEMVILGNFGGPNGSAFGINNKGQIVGGADTTGGVRHAFIVTPQNGEWFVDAASNGINDLMIDLGTLGGNWGEGLDINEAGVVVGRSRTALGDMHAFIWQQGEMFDLNDLIGPECGWELIEATAINEAGRVTGFGLVGGEIHGFLLTDVPQIDPGQLRITQWKPLPGAAGDHLVVLWTRLGSNFLYTLQSAETRGMTNWSAVPPTSHWPVAITIWTNTSAGSLTGRHYRVTAETLQGP